MTNVTNVTNTVQNTDTNDTNSNTTDTNSSSSIEYNEVYEFRKTNVFNNISYDETIYYPKNFGFMFAVNFYNRLYDESKVRLQFTQNSYSPETGLDTKFLPLINCTIDMFPSEL